MKLRLPHTRLRLPHMKLRFPHMKLRLPHMKLRFPHMKLRLPHMKLRLLHMKLHMPRLKLHLTRLKRESERFKRRKQPFKPQTGRLNKSLFFVNLDILQKRAHASTMQEVCQGMMERERYRLARSIEAIRLALLYFMRYSSQHGTTACT
jgi:hypothetical protein